MCAEFSSVSKQYSLPDGASFSAVLSLASSCIRHQTRITLRARITRFLHCRQEDPLPAVNQKKGDVYLKRRVERSFARCFALSNGHALRAPFQRSNPCKQGHARMVDDLRFKVDRFAILSIKTCARASHHRSTIRDTRSDAIPPTIALGRRACGPIGQN